MAIKTDPIDSTLELADIAKIHVGDTASCEACMSTDAIERFAELSGDDNPLHMSADIASGYGFDRPVAHGMLAVAAISRLIGTQLPGRGSLWVSHDLRFSGPVLAGDRVLARVTVEQVSVGTGLVGLRTEVTNLSTQKTVLVGAAKVKVLPLRPAVAADSPIP
jgi:acyl dehydratase